MEQINQDDNFPVVNYDKNGIYLVDEILVSHKEIEPISNIIINYPLKNIDITENKIFRIIKILGQIVPLFNDPNDFIDNKLNEEIISQIEDEQYEHLIISAIEGAFWDYKLSLQEKNYVKSSDSFILSGRPGTGKTTVILFRLFCIYFNYILKKKHKLIDIENIKSNNNKNKNYDNKNNKNIRIENNNTKTGKKPTESLRVVFTSLSHFLCERQQSIFEQTMVRKMESNYNYNIDNNKVEEKLDLEYIPITISNFC